MGYEDESDSKYCPKLDSKFTYEHLTPLEYALRNTEADQRIQISEDLSENLYLGDPHKRKIGTYVAVSCELVYVGDQMWPALAQVSVVNFYGVVLLNIYVRPNG